MALTVFPNIVLKMSGDDQCLFQGQADAFLVLFEPHLGASLFVAISGEDGIKAIEGQIAGEILSGIWRAKIAGTPAAVELVEAFLKNLGIGVFAKMELSGASNEVLFLNEGFRLRVAEKPSGEKPIKILIIDDSLTMRKLLRNLFSRDPSLNVVGEAGSAEEGLDLARTLKPDVISLDINMPGLDGVGFLERMNKEGRIPSLILSSLNIDSSQQVLKALDAGAVDYMHKPARREWEELAPVLIDKIKAVAQSKSKGPTQIIHKKKSESTFDWSRVELIAIGSSTGGPQALKRLLGNLPEDFPPIVIVQHIPPVFSKAMAQHLNDVCKLKVREGADGEPLHRGEAVIAPGGFHMKIQKIAGVLKTRIEDSPAVNRFKPAVDLLFDSVATCCGAGAVGIILTGMGRDGAEGLLKMKRAGAFTIAQDQESCVVFGMPKEAIELDAALEVCSLADIPGLLTASLKSKKAA